MFFLEGRGHLNYFGIQGDHPKNFSDEKGGGGHILQGLPVKFHQLPPPTSHHIRKWTGTNFFYSHRSSQLLFILLSQQDYYFILLSQQDFAKWLVMTCNCIWGTEIAFEIKKCRNKILLMPKCFYVTCEFYRLLHQGCTKYSLTK